MLELRGAGPKGTAEFQQLLVALKQLCPEASERSRAVKTRGVWPCFCWHFTVFHALELYHMSNPQDGDPSVGDSVSQNQWDEGGLTQQTLTSSLWNHTTTRTSAFELVYGRRYSGKIASFVEVVLVLRRKGPNTKAGPQWIPGVWLSKTDGDDLHIVATLRGSSRARPCADSQIPGDPQEKPF